MDDLINIISCIMSSSALSLECMLEGVYDDAVLIG